MCPIDDRYANLIVVRVAQHGRSIIRTLRGRQGKLGIGQGFEVGVFPGFTAWRRKPLFGKQGKRIFSLIDTPFRLGTLLCSLQRSVKQQIKLCGRMHVQGSQFRLRLCDNLCSWDYGPLILQPLVASRLDFDGQARVAGADDPPIVEHMHVIRLHVVQDPLIVRNEYDRV